MSLGFRPLAAAPLGARSSSVAAPIVLLGDAYGSPDIDAETGIDCIGSFAWSERPDLTNLQGLGSDLGPLIGQFAWTESADTTALTATVTSGGGIAWAESPDTTHLDGAGIFKVITVQLVNVHGTHYGGEGGLKWRWWDSSLPTGAPTDSGAAGSIDANGFLTLSVISNLNSGDTGYLLVTDSNGFVGQQPSPKAFAAPVQVP